MASGKKHSKETAAIAFSGFVRKGLDQGLSTGGAFIDLRKAFDSVDHALLVKKLMSYGLPNYSWSRIFQSRIFSFSDFQSRNLVGFGFF